MANRIDPTLGMDATDEKSLAARHIATNLENYEAARSNFFVFTVNNLSNLLNTNYTGGLDNAERDDFMNTTYAEQSLRLNVTTASIPSYSVSVLTYKRGNDIVRFAGAPSWAESGNITVDDVVGLDTKSILYAWLRLAYDPHTTKGGRMKDYKKTCTLMEYTQDYKLIRKWTIEGCFITALEENEFNRESDEKRSIRATFTFDRAIMELPEVTNA